MKTKTLFFSLMFGIVLLSACQQEEDVQEQLGEQKPVITKSGCIGGGACLPEISISASGTNIVISWFIRSYSGDEACRYFTLSYSGTGIGSQSRAITSSGSIYLTMHSMVFSLTATVKCNTSQCIFCEDGLKYISTNDASFLTTPHDCNKEYNYITGEIGTKFGNYVLKLFYFSGMYGNSDKNLIPDAYRIVTYDSKTQNEFTMNGRISYYPAEIEMPDENPYLTHYVQLYSTECEYNTEHYLEYNYSPQNSVHFDRVNRHRKLH